MIKVIMLNWPIYPNRKCTELPGFKNTCTFCKQNHTNGTKWKVFLFFFFNIPSSDMKLKSLNSTCLPTLWFPGVCVHSAWGSRKQDSCPQDSAHLKPRLSLSLLNIYLINKYIYIFCSPQATYAHWPPKVWWVQIERCCKYHIHTDLGRMVFICGVE